jgi:guanylate kinase
LRSEIDRIWEKGHAVIFDVDVVGGLNLKRFFGDQALAVFVQPPSYDELERRLRHRSTETEDKIRQRMAKARNELAFAEDFDVVLVNSDLEKAIHEAKELITQFLNT